MTQWHRKSRRKKSGGLRTSTRRSDKLLAWIGSEPTNTRLGKKSEIERKKTKGAGLKIKTRQATSANVLDPSTKKIEKAEILTVKRNDANREFARSNIMTKGAIIEVKTSSGTKLARVTNRPGQSGGIDAVLVGQ